MRNKRTPLPSSRAKSQIRDFIDDEKSLGRATKSQIAAAIGIRPSHFSNLLNGRNEWKLDQLEKLADFLDVPIARLFEDRTGSDSSESGTEDRMVRALRTENRHLRSGLRADLSALLRQHLTDRRRQGTGDYPGNAAPTYPDTDIDVSRALPIGIRDLDALYDRPSTGPASESLWFGRDWLHRHGLDPAQCLIVRVQDESMGNTLPDGCTVLVNRGQREPREGRIYALHTDEGLVIRRAGRDDAGAWLLESDHPESRAVAWPDSAEVIGHVCWMARSL